GKATNNENDPGSYNITVAAANNCGVEAKTYFTLTVAANKWCGDGIMQPSFGEKCDSSDNVATSPADSSSLKQYDCTIDDCEFKGGWCGDGKCGSEDSTYSVDDIEVCGVCVADCGICVYNISGNIIDAMTLLPISGALVNLMDSADVVVQNTHSDANGDYSFIAGRGVSYKVTVTKSGYADGYSGFFVLNSDVIKDFALAGSGVGVARIVLSWGVHPPDLDAHLTFNGTHIYYSNFGPKNGAQLDVDDLVSYGPETITINALVAGVTYEYYVQDYTNCGNSPYGGGTTAGARVKVYNSGGIKIKEYNSPGAGCRWTVFHMTDEGVIF
ncbi:MAG: carboxypeptidase regulatory-like domain-containing protein, partial [Patescibacteria group bacterium]|nr:carboxypeptidase regulatory-like domain-containing protein [Patescibacteria group bacterium]